MGTGEFTAGGNCDGLASHPGGVEILLDTSCYGNWEKLWPDEPLGSYADFNQVLLARSVKPSLSHTEHMVTLKCRQTHEWFLHTKGKFNFIS